ncbi:DUF4394 domain-containing protein [Caldimonas tepidiphila]|uniref:DUF4394 domain-containing protein n=1 Tax=Caldimonas tepidiphila TaxID=2315841 RepID=UPI000E5B4CBA|nr:DUF4394 domain-containing protein [Caldimonas tepidiphila]
MFRKTFIASTVAVLAACGGGGGDGDGNRANASGDAVMLTASGKLISFDRADPATVRGSVSVSGLASGETLLGIDFRPADGLLYALSSTGRLYTVDASSGAATLKATLQVAAGDDNPFAGLAGSQFGVDFNPAADRLRVVSDAGQNLRINVDTGDTITDGALAATGGSASVTASAYTNAFAGTVSTQLFALDAASGLRYLQDPPNAGTLGSGVDVGVRGAGGVNGFDIDARSNAAYAALRAGNTTQLYRIDLSAAAGAGATSLGPVASGEAVVGLALRQPAPATVFGLTVDGRLVRFDPRTPNTLSAELAITGLRDAGERVVGIDFRPADGMLYALSASGNLYTVDPATGAAAFRSRLAADAADTSTPYTALAGTSFSVDFNPVADRLRVVSDTGQNLRINVDTGATTTDGEVRRATGSASVAAAAYTNSFAGAQATTLFDLDAAADVLAQQVPPNEGTLVEVGPLGRDVAAGSVAFDIAGGGNAAYAALRSGASGPFSLYSVSLATGAVATPPGLSDPALAQIGGAGGPQLLDIAVRL